MDVEEPKETPGGQPHGPINLEGLKTYSIKERKNLVSVEQFARPLAPPQNFKDFLDSLPRLLASEGFLKVIRAIVEAHKRGSPVVMAMGGHVIKCGLSLLLVDLMERGVLTAIAMNSAAAIHDLEISLIGATSEDVKAGLRDGSFGMARETAEAFQVASSRAVAEGIGLGRALGKKINEDSNKFASFSILSAADRLDIPSTIHTTIGADTIHMHPNISGRNLGESSYIDFRILASVVSGLEGGVWLNVGSAVVMPEVFLKVLCLARNLGHKVENFVTVDMDMLQHYRPRVNVVLRPAGQGYSLTGHHEIMLPLLRMGVLSMLEG